MRLEDLSLMLHFNLNVKTYNALTDVLLLTSLLVCVPAEKSTGYQHLEESAAYIFGIEESILKTGKAHLPN
jgi:hypothetical protein